MRLLAIGDLHGSMAIYRQLPGLADRHGADALVLAGDLFGGPEGDGALEPAQRAHAAAIREILAPARIPVLYVLGNDDFVPLEGERPQFVPLRGRRVSVGDWSFVGYQYSPPFMGGIHEKTEAEIAADMAELEPLLQGAVFVTHCPANGIRDGSDSPDPTRALMAAAGVSLPPGSPAIRAAIERRGVHAHIHGHVHRAFGREGRHFNVASGPKRLRAMLIELERLEHQVLMGPDHRSHPAGVG